MESFLRLSEAAALALHSMAMLATAGDALLTASGIAQRLGVSANHLAKVHQRLSRAGLIESIRGPRGGVRLARSPSEISLLDVYEAIEGPAPEATCLLPKPVCGDAPCILGSLLSSINAEATHYLRSRRLADIAAGGERKPGAPETAGRASAPTEVRS
jgi:Rrf2 family protein